MAFAGANRDGHKITCVTSPHDEPALRFAELMAVFAQACELAMGRPVDHALHSTALALRIARRLGLDEAEQRACYYQAMLRFIGCNADTELLAAALGDEVSGRNALALVHVKDERAAIAALLQHLGAQHAHDPPWQRVQAYARGLASLPTIPHAVFPGHCEVAQRLGERLGFDARFVQGLGQLYARWDGRGIPDAAGEAILPAVRVVTVAHDVALALQQQGWPLALRLLDERSGRQYDPRICELLRTEGPAFCEADAGLRWPALWALEPGAHECLQGDALDAALGVLADHADIKSPWLMSHARRVADLASAAATCSSLGEAAARRLQRAGLLHDLGRVGVSAGIWGKPGPLSQGEWTRVQQHSLYTRQVLAVSPALRDIAELASAAHERCDGSGYFRGPVHRDAAAELLAAADSYAALTEHRPHRAAWPAKEAADELRRMAGEGRLDRAAVDAVLAAEGHVAPRTSRRRQAHPAGLTEREVQVLAELARGHTNKLIARHLGIAPKTVGRHIESIYGKAGVSTRAGATLFAMENGLV